jgi:hypothetical protein
MSPGALFGKAVRLHQSLIHLDDVVNVDVGVLMR